MTTLSPLRTGRITGSRIAGVLGISPYDTADDVLREMVRQTFGADQEFTGNRATEWGRDHEPHGIAEWQWRNGQNLYRTGEDQQFVRHPLVDYLGVTPDGLTADGNVVEVKCPLWGGYTVWQDVPWYEAQCRLTADAVQADWVDFVVWRPEGAVISRIEHDPWWLESVMPTLEAFMARYEQTVADEKLHAPMLEPLGDVRTDPEWSEAATRYREALALERAAAVHTTEARQALLALTDKPAKGAGVSVSRSVRRGTVDYRQALAELAPGADVESYRKDESVVWAVRVNG